MSSCFNNLNNKVRLTVNEIKEVSEKCSLHLLSKFVNKNTQSKCCFQILEADAVQTLFLEQVNYTKFTY